MAGFERISDLVNAYYEGMYAGDEIELRRVFDPTTRVRGFFADRYLDSDLEGFIAAMVTSPNPKALGQGRQLEILETREDGNLATVIVRDALHGMTFIDHLSLVRTPAGWRAVGKTYATPSPLPPRS